MRRVEEVEILRAISCIAVVMLHISAFVNFSGNVGKVAAISLSFINVLSVFAVPAFLVISGYTLTYQYLDRKLILGRFWLKRLAHVLIPYLVWTCIYYGFFVVQRIYQLSIKILLKELVLGNMVYHLYFVVLIVQFYLLFGLFRYLWSRFNSWLMPLLFLAINILFMRYVSFMYIDRFFLRYVFFFALGGYMAHQREQVKAFLNSKATRLLLCLGYLLLACWACLRYYQKFVLLQPYDTFTEDLYWILYSTITLLCYWSVSQYLAKAAPAGLKKLLGRIGHASYYIYLAHPLAIFFAQYILGKIPSASTISKLILVLGLVFGLVFPLAVYYQEHKDYLTKRLIKLAKRLKV